MLTRADAEAYYGFLTKRLYGFRSVQALDQHAVRSHQDRGFCCSSVA
jgi:hypothetical protein